MSLQVWLPLTKDLRQQGLSNVTVTNNGATFNSAGKLGGCYSFDGTDDNLSYTPSVDGIETLSIAFWVCPTAATPTGSFFSLERDTYWQLTFYGDYVGIRDNSIGYSGTRKNFPTGTYIANAWTHVAVTYDKGTLKIYRDGSLLSTNSVGGTKFNTSINNARIGSAVQSGYYYSGKMNDVRIYDNCLSPMEIKELAKGLVLHYPLDRQGWGQENLATNTSFPNSNIEGYSGQKAIEYNHSDWTSGGRYFAGDSNSRLTFTEIQANQPYTISAWVYIYSDVTLSNPGGTTVFYRIYKTGDSPTYSYDIYFDLSGITERNKWIKISKTFISSYTYTYNQGGTFQIGGYNGHFKVSMPKVEKGSIATPWCPNSSDALAITMGLNSTTEYDCSGFCNNGTQIGTFSWTSDTPKYSVSTYFPNTTTTTTFDDKCWITAPFILNNINQLTISFWFKKEAITRGGLFTTNVATYTGTDLTVDDYDNSVKIRASDGTSVTLGSYDNLIPANTWCHWVVTFDGINIKVYVNSILKNTVSYSETKMLKNITNITLGANKAGGVYRTAKGNYSDFRIYTTALSADDIKSLYQNCATIDPDGTIRGQIRS